MSFDGHPIPRSQLDQGLVLVGLAGIPCFDDQLGAILLAQASRLTLRLCLQLSQYFLLWFFADLKLVLHNLGLSHQVKEDSA